MWNGSPPGIVWTCSALPRFPALSPPETPEMDRINLYWLLIAALFVFPLAVVGVLKFALRKRGGLGAGWGAALVVLMCWCRFVCPFGAALELARKFSVLRLFRTAQCNDCDRCRQVCAMRTRPDEENCTNCGDCAGSCPTDCIRFGVKRHGGKGNS